MFDYHLVGQICQLAHQHFVFSADFLHGCISGFSIGSIHGFSLVRLCDFSHGRVSGWLTVQTRRRTFLKNHKQRYSISWEKADRL